MGFVFTSGQPVDPTGMHSRGFNKDPVIGKITSYGVGGRNVCPKYTYPLPMFYVSITLSDWKAGLGEDAHFFPGTASRA